MKVFNLIFDEYIKTWRRNYVTVSANNLEEAIKMIVEDSEDIKYNDSEEIFECEEPILNSNGERIVEIMNIDFTTIYDNSK